MNDYLNIDRLILIICLLKNYHKNSVWQETFSGSHVLEEFEDTKGVIRIRKSNDRKHNGQKKKNKRTNNDLQNNTHKSKD